MLGQMLCYITILILPIIYLVHYIPLMFAFPMAGNFAEIIMFLTPMVIAALGMGFMFQGIVWERESVFVLWVVTSVVFLFLSGLTYHAMPWLRSGNSSATASPPRGEWRVSYG